MKITPETFSVHPNTKFSRNSYDPWERTAPPPHYKLMSRTCCEVPTELYSSLSLITSRAALACSVVVGVCYRFLGNELAGMWSSAFLERSAVYWSRRDALQSVLWTQNSAGFRCSDFISTIATVHKWWQQLCVSCPCAFLTERGVEVEIHTFLTSALDGGEWLASRPGRFTPRERAPGAHCIGGWVDPRAGPDEVVKRKIPSPYRDSNPDHPARSPALYHWAILANNNNNNNNNNNTITIM
jgi:hypothetical protein